MSNVEGRNSIDFYLFKGERLRIERFENIEARQLALELTRKDDHTRAAVKGFIKYLVAHERGQ